MWGQSKNKQTNKKQNTKLNTSKQPPKEPRNMWVEEISLKGNIGTYKTIASMW